MEITTHVHVVSQKEAARIAAFISGWRRRTPQSHAARAGMKPIDARLSGWAWGEDVSMRHICAQMRGWTWGEDDVERTQALLRY